MGLEINTSDALLEAGFESYWKNGICYVAGDRSNEDRERIVNVANTVLNSDSEFYSWDNYSEDVYNIYSNYTWCLKTRSIGW